MKLIDKIHNAVLNGTISSPFTTSDIKRWANQNSVVKDNGEPYSESSLESILSNSDFNNLPTSNQNQKMLHSRIREDGKKEYWF
ncbi:MAG: hypothetical protein SCALA702_00510 [Melioribacteraceae bacterium]|nr:MAG: hypothetical protein SCALA702_00510 [Melioribacteraceae bacterium]